MFSFKDCNCVLGITYHLAMGVKYGSGCSLNLVKPGARHSGGIGPPRQVHLGAHLSGAGQHFLVQGFAQGWHVAAFYSTTVGSYDHFWSHTGPGGNKSGSENAQQGILKSFCPSPDWILPTSYHIVVKCSPLGSQINACQGEIKPVIDLDDHRLLRQISKEGHRQITGGAEKQTFCLEGKHFLALSFFLSLFDVSVDPAPAGRCRLPSNS